MPEKGSDRDSSRPTRRVWLASTTCLAFVVLECAIMVLMVRRIGLALPVGWQAVSFMLSLVPAIAAGYAIHSVVHFRRGRRDELREIFRPASLGLTLLLFASLVVLMVFYSGLKSMTPLLTDRSFDELLWRLDSALFFGMSPNVFFVNLLDQSALLRFIDFGYGYFFFAAVLVSFPLILPLRNDRFRTSFVIANVLLWSAGAWLYFAFPSLGPAYRFHEVWDAIREQFPVSTYWQGQLFDNYTMVLGIAEGRIDPALNLVEGIAAFPSLHVGFQALFALYLGGLSRVAGRAAWLLVLLTFLGSILTGWHYMIDSVAGLVLAVGIWLLVERVIFPEGINEHET